MADNFKKEYKTVSEITKRVNDIVTSNIKTYDIDNNIYDESTYLKTYLQKELSFRKKKFIWCYILVFLSLVTTITCAITRSYIGIAAGLIGVIGSILIIQQSNYIYNDLDKCILALNILIPSSQPIDQV